MRVSREQAEKNRANVVNVAGRLFRKRGFDGVGIADIMQAAGLTHGGFYRQFGSKDALAAEASAGALAATRRRWEAVLREAREAPLQAIAEFYLTPSHRDHAETGCAFAALAPDAARAGPEVKAVFESGLESKLELVTEALKAQGVAAADVRAEALAALSTLVGALALSRAVNDPALSDEILAAAARSLGALPDG